MSGNKTRASAADVGRFLDGIAEPQKREDAKALCATMARLSGKPPAIWGGRTVGFGTYRYRYESGREGEWFVTGFAPGSRALTIYVMDGFSRHQDLMDRLGRYRTGKSCLYVKRLSDVEMPVLERLIAESLAHMRQAYETDLASQD